jgi:hypothetical protein
MPVTEHRSSSREGRHERRFSWSRFFVGFILCGGLGGLLFAALWNTLGPVLVELNPLTDEMLHMPLTDGVIYFGAPFGLVCGLFFGLVKSPEE